MDASVQVADKLHLLSLPMGKAAEEEGSSVVSVSETT
jgi:hypothetical protein